MNSCVTHCCIVHGCKYGKADCVIKARLRVQEYLCESCDYAQEEYKEAIRLVEEGPKNWFSPPYLNRVFWNGERFELMYPMNNLF